MEYLQNCNVVYLTTKINEKLLFGKIVVSIFPELDPLFSRLGIVHIVNLDQTKIPLVDCIISSSNEYEELVIKSGLEIPIVYLHNSTKWCGVCGKTDNIYSNISKYCSEECMNKICNDSKDINHEVYINVLNSSMNNSAKNEKFHKSVLKDAIRLDYAMKRESYKKEMRQPSLRKISSVKNETVKLCKSVTKKGVKCKNKVIGNSDYCGIISHMSS